MLNLCPAHVDPLSSVSRTTIASPVFCFLKFPSQLKYCFNIRRKSLKEIVMKFPAVVGLVIVLGVGISESSAIPIPYSTINTPVVHAGQFHVLNANGTYVILDGAKGMSIRIIGLASSPEEINDPLSAIINDASLRVSLTSGSESLELDQAFDPDAQLLIIAQGPGYVAARAFFRMCSSDGFTHGTGTMDVYVYQGSVYLVPSLFLDYESGGVSITKAGFYSDIQGKNARVKINEAAVNPKGLTHFESFGADTRGFNVIIEAPARPSVKIGWLRNKYPQWLYMKEIIVDSPETDEMYENWLPWISQRGRSLTWNRTASSGLLANYSEKGSLKKLSFLWVNNDPVEIPVGGFSIFNGLMAVFLDDNPLKVNENWHNHGHPIKPQVRSGDFRYYNEVEGVYEIDSQGGDVDVTFDCLNETCDRQIFACHGEPCL